MSPSAFYPTLVSVTAMIHLESGRQLPSLAFRRSDPQGYETTFTFIRMRAPLPATRVPTLRGPGGKEVRAGAAIVGVFVPAGFPGPSDLAQAGASQAPSSAAPPRGVARVPRARRERRGGGARAWAARSRAEQSGTAASAPAGPRAAEPGAASARPAQGQRGRPRVAPASASIPRPQTPRSPAPYRHLLSRAAGPRRCGRGSARTPAEQLPRVPAD